MHKPRKFIVATLLAALWSAQAIAAEPCDRVVSYFLYPYQDSKLKQHEWRVFDPVTRTDRLFLAGARGVDGVRWDTTFTTAYFNSGGSLYRVAWRFGATPKLIGPLQPVQESQGWWFNPDSSCWQVAEMSPVGSRDTTSLWWCRVWQSNKEVTRWRVVRSDTVACESSDCGEWPWSQEPWARRAAVVTLEDALREADVDEWTGRASPFDTATVSLIGSEGMEGWYFIPSQTSPRRGIGFRLMYSDKTVVSAPFYFVDLDSRTKTLISALGESEGWVTSFLSAHCGLLLLSAFGDPLLIDATTGRTIFSQPWNSNGAVWVPPPMRRE